MRETFKLDETQRIDASRYLAATLAAIALAGLIGAGVLLAHAPSTSRAGALGATLVLAGYFVASCAVAEHARRMMLRVFFAMVVGAYAADIFLFVEAGKSVFAQAAQRLGVPFDARERPEVLRDLRRSGAATTSYVPDQMIARLGTDKNGFFPLSGIANVTTVFCNELGKYLIYHSDEHGFNNPPGLYAAGGHDVVTIGDSFVLGGCVQPDQSIASLLRTRGFKGLSLGVAGSGPLVDLAILQEYATALKPADVLWFYTEGNDREDFADETASKLLMAYFDRGFSQKLFGRQMEIDAFVRSLELEAAAQKPARGATLRADALDLLSLRNLRYTLASAVNKPAGPDLPDAAPAGATDALLGKTFREAKERAAAWGGKLWVVYLPDQRRYALTAPAPADLFSRESTLRILAAENIPVIDFKAKMDTMADPLRFYAFRHHAHYTPEGYAMLADLIAARLRAGN